MKITRITASLINGSGIVEDNIYDEWKVILDPILYDVVYGDIEMIMTGQELILKLFGDDIRPPITKIYIYVEHGNDKFRLGIGNSRSSEVYIEKL